MSGNPKAPGASMLARHGSKILASGLLVGTAFAYFAMRPPAAEGTKKMNPLNTPGVKNIETAYESGGATATHTPAYGGTIQGRGNSNTPRESSAKGRSPDDEHMGNAQRPDPAGKPMEKFREMQYGTTEGK